MVHHTFPADGEYVFKMTFYYSSIGPVFGASQKPGEQKVEVAVNGERMALLDIQPEHESVGRCEVAFDQGEGGAADHFRFLFANLRSGRWRISRCRFEQPWRSVDWPHSGTDGGCRICGIWGFRVRINMTDVGDTPSRRRDFLVPSQIGSDEVACAKKHYREAGAAGVRRPVTDADLETLLNAYQAGRNKGDFDAGIKMVVQAIVADPQFVFRFERIPADAAAGSNFRISDLELASRLSYFLWSSAPDDALIDLAQPEQTAGAGGARTAGPANAGRSTIGRAGDRISRCNGCGCAICGTCSRMCTCYPDWDQNLMQSMRKETELFFESIMHEDRNVVDMLTANYTFVDERLAKHYGIPNVTGNRFRRVTMTDPNRFGLLGQGSILMATSLANRTSPVQRGKWILEQVLGVTAPTPPPNVPALKENAEGAQSLIGARTPGGASHERALPLLPPDHGPMGFSLENFDAIGAWRINDGGYPVDPSGQLYDGTKVNGPVSLRAALVGRSDMFVRNFTEKLLTYALGRGVRVLRYAGGAGHRSRCGATG